MNFFKKIMGYSTDLNSQLKKAQFAGTLFRVVKDARSIMFPLCKIGFDVDQDGKNYSLRFENVFAQGDQTPEYQFPIHTGMNLVSFSMTKNGKENACFEWVLDENDKEIEHVGCYMPLDKKDSFKELLCKVIHLLYNDENVKNPLDFCKELTGVPIYKDPHQSNISSASQKVVPDKGEQFNQMLIIQANKKDNKFVHSASCYEIIDKQRKLLYEPIICVLRAKGQFAYQIQLSNQTGYLFIRKQLTPSLTYQVNTQEGYMKWLHLQEGNNRIIEVYFGKRDVALSFKFALMEAMYEINTKRNLLDSIPPQQFSYVKQINEKPAFSQKQNQRIVKIYEDKEELESIDSKVFTYDNEEVHKGLERYRSLSQGKIGDFSVASLGAMLQVLKISEDNQIKRIDKVKVYTKNNQPIQVDDILLHQGDTKTMLHGADGSLYYQDLQKGTIIEQYSPSRKGIQHICPQFKLAQRTNYKTFKAVSPNTIYRLDPRSPEGVVNMKAYQTSPEFCEITTDANGNIAVGSLNGQIRLYDEVGKNANCKFPAFGDPVQHLQSTKDGKWLLATFKTYLLILPTETQDQRSMYHQKIPLDSRPRPIKLQIKMQHLQICKVKELKMIPAKFDERADSKERFIISGFGEYVVVWNLADVVAKGNTKDYKFFKVDGEMIQADFRWNDVKRLVMTTDKGILIKENKIAR